MAAVKNITVAGLGGQGVLKATDILAEVLFRAGFDVKKSEVHGMSQRGGSISSDVRFGGRIGSPMVPYGECDILVLLDDSQEEIHTGTLRKNGMILKTAELPLDKLSNRKALNVMALGRLSAELPEVSLALWHEVLADFLPAKVLEMNTEMFALGRAAKK